MSLRVLFAGLGSIGQRHLRNLHAVTGWDVDVTAFRTSASDRILSDAVSVEAETGLASRYRLTYCRDLRTALNAGVDVVFVTNPTSTHMAVALEAAKANCHLFIEKPLSNSWDHVDTLAAMVERHGRVGYVGYQWRFHPAFQRISQWLAEELIGPVVGARLQVAEYLPDFHTYEDYRQTYPARRDLGGGVILSQIHEFDMLYAWFGMPQQVYCAGGRLGDLAIDVEDIASTTLQFERRDGRCFPVHVHQDFLQRPPERTTHILGQRGKIAWNLRTGEVVRYAADGSMAERHSYAAFERNEMFVWQMRHFLACVHGEAAPLVSIRDGAASLRMALAATESLRTRSAVELQEVPAT